MSAPAVRHRTEEDKLLWEPQEGPQEVAFYDVPPRWEVFYGGARGGGKTDLLIALAGRHCLRYGEHAACLILRMEYKQLRSLKTRADQLYRPKGARWQGSEQCYYWPSGARIYLGHCRTEEDTEKYQGWDLNFLGIEEIGNWPNDAPLVMMLGACRSVHGIPVRWIATGNPGGRGHAWVKEEFIEGAEPYIPRVVKDPNGRPALGLDGGPAVRVFIPARVADNPKLMENDPAYVGRLRRQVGHLAQAWLEGDWDVAPGAYLEGVWDPSQHVMDDFLPPYWWRRWPAVDWGFAKPYSIGWYCVRPDDGAVIRYRELYGWGGRANVGTRESVGQVAARWLRAQRPEPPNAMWRAAVGDASMWSESGHEKGVSIASLFRDAGVRLRRGPEGPHTRLPTTQLLVDRLRAGLFYVTRSCRHWLRTVPVLAPDPDNPEDVDTEGEDHAWDETRYALWSWDVLRRGDEHPDKAVMGRPRRPRIAGVDAGPAPLDPRTLRPAFDPSKALDAFRTKGA